MNRRMSTLLDYKGSVEDNFRLYHIIDGSAEWYLIEKKSHNFVEESWLFCEEYYVKKCWKLL
jgi:hypothetical protein